jgi:hypothetical protein
MSKKKLKQIVPVVVAAVAIVVAAPIAAAAVGATIAGSTTAASVATGAITGAAAGGAAGGTAASLSGQNILEGAGRGAAIGAAGGGVGGLVSGGLAGVAPTEAVQAASGAARGATTAAVAGGDVRTGALAGGVGGGIAGATGPALQGVVPREAVPALTGALSGAGASAVRGGDIAQGATMGALGGVAESALAPLRSAVGEAVRPGTAGGPVEYATATGGGELPRTVSPAGVAVVAPGFYEGSNLPGVNLPEFPLAPTGGDAELLPMPPASGQIIDITRGVAAPAPGQEDIQVEVVGSRPGEGEETPDFALGDIYREVPDILRFVEADLGRTQRAGGAGAPRTTTAGLGFGGGGMSAQDRQIAELIGFSASAPQTRQVGGTTEGGRARGGETGTGARGTGEGAAGGRPETFYSSTGVGPAPSGYRSQLPGILSGAGQASRTMGFGAAGPEGFAPMQFDGGERKLRQQRPVWNVASLRVKEDEGVV